MNWHNLIDWPLVVVCVAVAAWVVYQILTAGGNQSLF